MDYGTTNGKCDNCKTELSYSLRTYRELLQYLGTELLRNQLHKNVWINSLFSKYKPTPTFEYSSIVEFPNWIISDVRFKNECKAIKDRNGILIKINRDIGIQSTHQSEIELDSYTDWDYEINNNGSIEDLIKQVKDILLKEEII